MRSRRWLSLSLVLGLFLPASLFAHCDTLDGPVVVAARAALEKGDVTPVLKWVRPEDEAEVRSAFQKTLAARSLGPAARDVADRWFYETVVRLHRAGEGEPYTGLKPAGLELGPAIEGADRALESGSVEPLLKVVNDRAADGIRERFARARAALKNADRSVAQGREYVRAYVEFVHYVDRLYEDATAGAAHRHD